MKTIAFIVTEPTPELETLLKNCAQTLHDYFSLIFITAMKPLNPEFKALGSIIQAADQEAINTVLDQHTEIEAIQSFALITHEKIVKHYLHRQHTPFFIMTHYQQQAVADNRNNKRIFNRCTDINLFMTQENQAATEKIGCLHLKNPVLLEQTKGVLDWYLYLHTYQAMLQPNRTTKHDLVKTDYSDIRLSYITNFYCNQNDISSVTDLLYRYEKYDKALLAQVLFVIVDDGSPIEYAIPDFKLNVIWLKIDEDIPWNLAGGRNLGVAYAKSDTVFMTDLDHELPEESMKNLIKRKSCGRHLYKVWRTRSDSGERYKGHANLFVLSRGRFFELFGYDEEFSGGYGAEDFRLVKYNKAMGTVQKYLPKSITVQERTDINHDKSYHTLKRDLSFNTGTDSRKRKELLELGHGYGHSRMFLNFKWHILKEIRLNYPIARKMDKGWKQRWLLRQILPRA